MIVDKYTDTINLVFVKANLNLVCFNAATYWFYFK